MEFRPATELGLLEVAFEVTFAGIIVMGLKALE
jgi:hypothetical protein